MYARARKVEWLSMKNRVPTDRGEFRPVEVPLVTAEAGSLFRKIGEEVTCKIMVYIVHLPLNHHDGFSIDDNHH